MRQHPHHFRFIVRRFDQAGVNKHGAARQREGINGIVIHKAEVVRVRVRLWSLRQFLADHVQPRLHLRTLYQFHLVFHIRGRLLAQVDFLSAGERGLLNLHLHLSGPVLRREFCFQK